MSVFSAVKSIWSDLQTQYWSRLGQDCASDVARRGLVLSEDPVIRELQLRNWLMHITSEVAEAFEELRHGRMTTHYSNDNGLIKPEGVAVELADAVMAIASFCAVTGIDLSAAIDVKMAYNCQRPPVVGRIF